MMRVYGHLKIPCVRTNFSHFADWQLKLMLIRDHGYVCGPITPTTRFVYEYILQNREERKGKLHSIFLK